MKYFNVEKEPAALNKIYNFYDISGLCIPRLVSYCTCRC